MHLTHRIHLSKMVKEGKHTFSVDVKIDDDFDILSLEPIKYCDSEKIDPAEIGDDTGEIFYVQNFQKLIEADFEEITIVPIKK